MYFIPYFGCVIPGIDSLRGGLPKAIEFRHFKLKNHLVANLWLPSPNTKDTIVEAVCCKIAATKPENSIMRLMNPRVAYLRLPTPKMHIESERSM